jgi:hypothetical protein
VCKAPSDQVPLFLFHRLLDHGLRHNFLLHLLNLWDNSLLNSRAIIDCMLIVDQNQVSWGVSSAFVSSCKY